MMTRAWCGVTRMAIGKQQDYVTLVVRSLEWLCQRVIEEINVNLAASAKAFGKQALHQPATCISVMLQCYVLCTNLLLLFFYPRYQGSRGVWKKIRRKCVGVTITPGSPQTQRNLVAARRWIAALARKRAGTKKLSLARRRSDDWFSWPEVRKKSEADSLIGPRVSTAIGNYYYYYYYASAPIGGSIKRCFCMMSDVCLSRTSGLSREQRGLGGLKLGQR